MKLKYYSQFSDIDNNTISLQIYIKSDLAVTSLELLLAENPITIEYKSGELFKPLKQSCCSVNVLTDDILSDLYTGSYDSVKCIIKKNGTVFWTGFLTPNIYTSEYSSEYDLLTLEFIDYIAVAENTKYSKVNDTSSFIDIIYSILDTVDADGDIKLIYFPKVYTISSGVYNAPHNLYIQERNFFDEENEPQSNKEVLNDITLYYGMSLILDGERLVFVDYAAIDTTSYYVYNRASKTVSNGTLLHPVKSIGTSNISESAASISLNGLFNKVNVIAVNNPVDSVIPDPLEDDLVNQNVDLNKYYESTTTVDDEEYTLLNAYFKSNNYTLAEPTSIPNLNAGGVSNTITEVTNNNIDTIWSGSFFQKVEEYKTAEEPSSLNWSTYLTMASTIWMYNRKNDSARPYLSLNKDISFLGKGGYFIADIEFRLSNYLKANNCLKTDSDLYTGGQDLFDDTLFPCRLAIGDSYYYDGDEWVSYDDYLLKISRGYYQYGVIRGTDYKNEKVWYKVKDSYGYWKYATQAQYNASTAVKATGGYSDEHYYCFYDDNNNTVYIEESYYHECVLGDKFYLCHTNKIGDNIFDETKRLTNTVSWRMNLANSEDGVAIKMPNFTVNGNLTFELYLPNQIGTYPCLRINDSSSAECKAIHISKLSLIYTTSDTVVDIFNLETYDPDILYTNTIDEGFVAELDDVEMKVNTYSPKAVSYSYVMVKDSSGNYDYIDKVTYNNNTYNAEEHLVNKYVSHYSTPKYSYSNCLINDGITPYTLFKETTLNKKMVVDEVEYNLANNSANVTGIEL